MMIRAAVALVLLVLAGATARELWWRHVLAALEREASARAAASRDRARD